MIAKVGGRGIQVKHEMKYHIYCELSLLQNPILEYSTPLHLRSIPPLTPLLLGKITALPVVIATRSSVPPLQPICQIGDVRTRSTLRVGQIREVDLPRIVPARSLVRVTLGVAGIRGQTVLADPLHVTGALGRSLGTVTDHVQDRGRHVVWVVGDRASVSLHQTAVLDAVVCASDADIAGGLGLLVQCMERGEEEEGKRTSCMMTARMSLASTLDSCAACRMAL